MTRDLLVSEVFGPTIQGEGPLAGTPAVFVRLGLCNLSCSWCDTPYTWDWDRYDRTTELSHLPTQPILDFIRVTGVPLLVVTGGEPLVQANRLVPFLEDLRRQVPGVRVQVETNGTMAPPPPLQDLVDDWSVSPKLPHANLPPRSAHQDAAAATAAHVLARQPSVAWKFVAQRTRDLEDVAAYVAHHDLDPGTVWIMPEGTTVASQERPDLAEAAIGYGYRFTLRAHVVLWGNRRGV